MKRLALVVHGGAWEIPESAVAACREGCRRALERGWAVLTAGASALEACEQAIVELENNPVFDAGIGSHLNRDGRVQLDAILMDGSTLKSGAVAAVERLRNPIQVARLVLERSEHMLIVGPGAEQFAVEKGLSLCDPSELVVAREADRWYRQRGTGNLSQPGPGRGTGLGTVGAVALDGRGNLAAGTSTGGTCCKYPGRVGDSPLVGCGCYADNQLGAVSCTGEGESIMKLVLAKTAADLLGRERDSQAAAEKAVELLAERTQGQGGLILVDPHGAVGAAFSTSHMAYGYRTSDAKEFVVRV